MRNECYHADLARIPQMLALARDYHVAVTLFPGPMNSAPIRLCAIHAVELYLNVFLLGAGYSFPQLRKLGHDLGKRAALTSGKGLKLRKGTLAHLEAMSAEHAYLAARYGPQMPPSLRHDNRVAATLKEIAAQVHKAIAAPKLLCPLPTIAVES